MPHFNEGIVELFVRLKNSKNNKTTETLNFCIGGFPGDYVRIIWLDEKLYHLCDTKPPEEELIPDHVLNVITPSIKEWEEFWLTVDLLKVWSWEKKYVNSGICDGTEWELRIKRKGRRRRKIVGMNAYPQPEGTFESFLDAITKLSRGKIEF